MQRSAMCLPVLIVAFAVAASAQAGYFQLVDGDFESAAAIAELDGINDAQVNQGWYKASGATVGIEKIDDGSNVYGSLGSNANGGFHQCIPTTGVTGAMQLQFDVIVYDAPQDENSFPAPSLRVGMWGETNPWNSLFGGDSPGLNQNKPNPDILPEVAYDLSSYAKETLPKIEIDLSLANPSTWTTYSFPFDLGPTGFNHSQGGSAGGPYAYLAFGFNDIYNWAGDYVYIDNVEFVPEPATMAMLAIGGAGLLARRKH